ncbi:MAG: ATP-dependent 6-phosphofructokinase [Acidobacteriota bacterium]|nr:ATP-dependent 6-phosphofructokinase [Acidobacteriota bacterium]
MATFGVLTGGGDCPGLNAVIRAVVRRGLADGHRLVGFHGGWLGIRDDKAIRLTLENTAGLVTRGGTILGTSRIDPCCDGPDGLETMRATLRRRGIDALAVIGGDGTLSAARDLSHEGFPLVAIPKTIDNDIAGTDFSIGFQTAVQTATDAIDRLHTTAESHNRVMVVEVMGRHAGWIAASAGLASGADVILVPERPFRIEAARACGSSCRRSGRRRRPVRPCARSRSSGTPARSGLRGRRRRPAPRGRHDLLPAAPMDSGLEHHGYACCRRARRRSLRFSCSSELIAWSETGGRRAKQSTGEISWSRSSRQTISSIHSTAASAAAQLGLWGHEHDVRRRGRGLRTLPPPRPGHRSAARRPAAHAVRAGTACGRARARSRHAAAGSLRRRAVRRRRPRPRCRPRPCARGRRRLCPLPRRSRNGRPRRSRARRPRRPRASVPARRWLRVAPPACGQSPRPRASPRVRCRRPPGARRCSRPAGWPAAPRLLAGRRSAERRVLAERLSPLDGRVARR